VARQLHYLATEGPPHAVTVVLHWNCGQWSAEERCGHADSRDYRPAASVRRGRGLLLRPWRRVGGLLGLLLIILLLLWITGNIGGGSMMHWR
jgi:hypothetical protein